MRTASFRVAAGILGILFLVGAFPIATYAPDGFWPDWIHPIPFLLLGTTFLIYGVTGRAWPRSYNDKILNKDDDLNDR